MRLLVLSSVTVACFACTPEVAAEGEGEKSDVETVDLLFTIDFANVNGNALTERVSVDDRNYDLFVAHSGGPYVELDDDDGDKSFYWGESSPATQLWTVSLKYAGNPVDFSLVGFRYKSAGLVDHSVAVENDNAEFITETTTIANGEEGAFPVETAEAAEDIAAFTIIGESPDATLDVAFDNIALRTDAQ